MKRNTPIIIALCGLLLMLSSSGCEQVVTLLGSINPWLRHTIDASSEGADGVKPGDVNDDGLMDLVVAWEDSGEVKAYLNPGLDQSWTRWPSLRVGQVSSVEDAVFVDLDSDGSMDVVRCAEGDTRSIFIHWAPDDFSRYLDSSAWTTEPLPAAQNTREWMFCLPMQVDGMNGIDLVAGAKGDAVQVGWFQAPDDPRDLDAWRWYSIADSGWTMTLIAIDMDGDDDLDVATLA